MKLNWSNARSLFAAAAVVIVSNAVALAGVAYNRSGESDSVLQLTEREVPIQYWTWPDNENSAVHLQLRWRVPGAHDGSYYDREADWLTAEQLRGLGFEVPPAGATVDELEWYARQPAREVFLTLEYDGPAYRAEMERSRESLRAAEAELAAAGANKRLSELLDAVRKRVDSEERFASRLFVVAADLDPEALRERYPDRKQYAIVRGRLHAYSSAGKPVASIDALSTAVIRVPHTYRTLVQPYLENRGPYYEDRLPRYAATVRFGRRLEPWIDQLSGM